MHGSPTVSITCDELVEFEEDAMPFAGGKAEFVNANLLPTASGASPAAPQPLPTSLPPDPEPKPSGA